MPAVINYGKASNRRNMARRRIQTGDGVTLTSPDGAANNFRRIDSKYVLDPAYTEIAALIEDGYNGEKAAYIKNTSGGSWVAGTLLCMSTTLTSAGAATGPTATTAGSSVTLTLSGITGTIESGSLCQFTDSVTPFPVQYAICTGVSGSDRTFDEIPYDMTSPAIAVIPAISATAATNASGGEAQWVVTATIANNGYAFVYASAYVTGINTSGYSAIGSKVYLGTAGASTPTAPATATTTSQRVGQVVIKNASTGAIKYYPGNRIIERFSNTSSLGLTNTNILVGNSSNVATDVALSGDATISNTGALTIANLAVTNAKIANTTIDLTAKVTGILPLANLPIQVSKRIATQTVTDSTTFVADNTLTATLVASHKYIFKLMYFFTTVATSGSKIDFNGGTATATNIEGLVSSSGSLFTSVTVLTSTNGSTGGTTNFAFADGYILCANGGTFIPRFAQQTETGAAESVIARIGSFMQVWDLGT